MCVCALVCGDCSLIRFNEPLYFYPHLALRLPLYDLNRKYRLYLAWMHCLAGDTTLSDEQRRKEMSDIHQVRFLLLLLKLFKLWLLFESSSSVLMPLLIILILLFY